jgi:hypothetical protein
VYSLGDAFASVVSLTSSALPVSQTEIDPGGELLEIGSGHSTAWSHIILDERAPVFADFVTFSCWLMSGIFSAQIVTNFL